MARGRRHDRHRHAAAGRGRAGLLSSSRSGCLAVIALLACTPGERAEIPQAEGRAASETPAQAAEAGATAVAAAAIDQAAAERALIEADAALRRAAAAGDLEALVPLLAPNARLHFPFSLSSVVTGGADRDPADAARFLGPGYDRELTLRGVEVSRSGDLGYADGRYAVRSAGDRSGPAWDEGKYLTVWRREAGMWQLAAAMTATDRRAPGAARDDEGSDTED